jgi:hypothetical protein
MPIRTSLVARGAAILGLLALTILSSAQANSRDGAPALPPAALPATDNDNVSNDNVTLEDIVDGDVDPADLVNGNDTADTVDEITADIVDEDPKNLNSEEKKQLREAKHVLRRQIREERKEDRQNADE